MSARTTTANKAVATKSDMAAPITTDKGRTVISGITTVWIAIRVAGRGTIIGRSNYRRYTDTDTDSYTRVCRRRGRNGYTASHQGSDCNFR
jgi:hypothetical protein